MTTIITKNSSTASAVPAAGSLVQGELAVNVTDKKLYTKDSGGTIQKIVGSLGNQEASAVAITGGSIAGITDLAIADGGTGASTASDARTNLGLGSIATQNSNSVSITGGSISGITDLAIADGGTGASDASTARTNLGLGSISTQAANSVAITGGSITGITDLAIADGGTGASTANDALNNLLPSQASASGKYLKSDGTNASWDQLDISTADITGTLPVLNGGTGATTASGARTNLGVTATGSDTTYAYRANNLSDLANAATARTNLGLGSIATQAASSVAITGGTIDGTTIGGTTRAAGSFTTLTLTNALGVANGGTGLTSFTANGVVYASSTSALTTGSALTFDGSQFGVGTASGTSNGLKLNAGNAGANYVLYRDGTTGLLQVYGNQSGFNGLLISGVDGQQYLSDPAKHIWSVSNTEQMRLTSTGLGIGTSSPGEKLVVANAAGSVAAQILASATGTSNLYFADGTTGADNYTGFIQYNHSTNAMNFGTNGGNTRATLDSSGNLGLGVTPSAWFSSGKAVQVGSGASLLGTTTASQMLLGANYYYNGSNNIYIASQAASYYQQLAGAHSWYTAPSGTAGNAISFTQAMTLDGSGRLVIGATSTAAKFQVSGTSANTYLLIDNAASGENYYAANLTHIFQTAGSERARIDSSGNLLVGDTTSGTVRLRVTNSASDDVALFKSSNATPYGVNVAFSGASPNNTTSYFYTCADSGPTTRFKVYSNGGIANYQANNVNLSDRREKTNFAPAKSYLDIICAIPVQTFNYIDQSEDDPGLTLGVVAQDVQAVAPELVMESNWGTKDEPKMRLSIYQTDLQYALMKAIQEQQAIIETLKARVAALESK